VPQQQQPGPQDASFGSPDREKQQGFGETLVDSPGAVCATLSKDGCCATPSVQSAGKDGCLLQMTCDRLCIRTMTVTYVGKDGQARKWVRTGYNATCFLPYTCSNVEVLFSVLGGGQVCQVDRSKPEKSWIKDAQGRRIPEKFSYSDPPPHVQFFIRGPSLLSWVAHVDERERTENLVELVAGDHSCVRTLIVAYKDEAGKTQKWTGSGYDVKCHIPAAATDVEVTFSVMGGRDVYQVDRRLPGSPWVKDAKGGYIREGFFYTTPPACAQFEARGPSLNCFISRVRVQQYSIDDLTPDMVSQPWNDASALFQEMLANVPAVGGMVELQEPHSDFLLPAQVVLFEPTEKEIFGRNGARQIFANTPLTEKETAAIGEFHKHLAKKGTGGANEPFPRFMGVHSLRLVQSAKFNMNKAQVLMDAIAKERVMRLPIREADAVSDLRRGFMYWHGRDKWCRPLMIIRLDRLGPLAQDTEAAMRVVVFTLEYALRFAMVPGRVENWVVLLDVANIMSVVSPLRIGGLISTGAALGKTLEKVYCGRMVWLKIVNLPGGDFLRRSVNSAIPEEKREKVSFARDLKAELKDLFEPNQLEEQYGGTAPNVNPGEAYPFRFFRNCRGALDARHIHHAEAVSSAAEPVASAAEPEDFSLHEATNLRFHEGLLWDSSSPEVQESWVDSASSTSLPPGAAEALSKLMPEGETVEPIREVDQWLKAMLTPGMCLQRSTSGLVRMPTRQLEEEALTENIADVDLYHEGAKEVEVYV